MNLPIALTLAALAGSASIASAENSLPLPRVQDSTSLLRFDHVNSEANGVLEIYDYDGHQIGRLLGVRPVVVGSNPDLRVILNPPPPVHDVMAILTTNGATRAGQVVEFDRNID